MATVLPAVFAFSAFGAALFHSITSQELTGRSTPPAALRRGQFDLRAVFWLTLLVAAGLGLWQASRPWAGELDFNLYQLEYKPNLHQAILGAGGGALLALLVGFRRWRYALPLLLGCLGAVALSDYFGFTAPQAQRLTQQLQRGLFSPTCFCLLPALGTIAWLRCLGFRLESKRS
jgi:hypothetical protein